MSRSVGLVALLAVVLPFAFAAEGDTFARRLRHHRCAECSDRRWPQPQPPPPPPPPQTQCVPENNVWRFGATYNDPTSLITSTALQCCDICRAEARCVTWARHRATGYCALKDQVLQAYIDTRYDSGFIDGSQAAVQTPAGSCFTQAATSYPGGARIERRRANSASECCRRCQNNINCFSWHRNRRNGVCVLNSNVPGRSQRGHFDGGSMV